MEAVLITIGDEILSGNTIDTNSNFIANELKNIGIKVSQIFTISDEIENIKKTLKQAYEIGDLIITTGGLGPTRDDKTKKAFAEFFKDEIVEDEETLNHLKQLLEKRNRINLLEINKSQAHVLSKAYIFQNYHGTAPSQMIVQDHKITICLPGVPFEVKPLIKNQIVPYLINKFSLSHIVSRIVSVVGVPESILAAKISDWEDTLPKHITLSYLPVGTRVKLRLTASGNIKDDLNEELNHKIQQLYLLIGENIIATQNDKIEEILHDVLTEKKLTISTAESCTGGEIATLITSVPGSSGYFYGGIVAYQTEKKIKLLKVSEKTVLEKTVVSEKVAEEMATGCKNLFETDIAISTTGVSGPAKGEDQHEIGTVFFSIKIGNFQQTKQLYLPHLERKDFSYFVSQKVLENLVVLLTNNFKTLEFSYNS